MQVKHVNTGHPQLSPANTKNDEVLSRRFLLFVSIDYFIFFLQCSAAAHISVGKPQESQEINIVRVH